MSKRCLLQSLTSAFYSLGNWNIFPLREFYKYWNKWKFEGAVSDEYIGWIRTFQSSCNSFLVVCLFNCNSFCLVKEKCGLAVFWQKIMHFLLTNSECLSSAAFSWSNCEQYLLELIIWFSKRSIHNITFFGWRTALAWLVVLYVSCPTISSIPHYCTVFTFHSPS